MDSEFAFNLKSLERRLQTDPRLSEQTESVLGRCQLREVSGRSKATNSYSIAQFINSPGAGGVARRPIGRLQPELTIRHAQDILSQDGSGSASSQENGQSGQQMH